MLGSIGYAYAISDGCSITRDLAEVHAECNTPPLLRTGSGGQATESVWNGTHFEPVAISSTAADVEDDYLTIEYTLGTGAFQRPSAPASNIESDVLQDDDTELASRGNGSAVLAPKSVGSWSFNVGASDGCTSVLADIRIDVVCSGTPEARAAQDPVAALVREQEPYLSNTTAIVSSVWTGFNASRAVAASTAG